MDRDGQTTKRAAGALLLAGAALCLLGAGCSDIQPAPNEEEGGMIDSPTQEQDQYRQEEEREGAVEEGARGRR